MPAKNQEPATVVTDSHVRPSPPSEGICPKSRPVRRVFYLVDSLNLGGTEIQAVEVARRLDPSCYQVTLGCLKAEGPLGQLLQGSAVQVLEFRPRGGIDSLGGVYELFRLASFLRRGRYDVLHTHDLWSNLLGVPAGWLARTPVIISSRRDLSHGSWYTPRRRRILRLLQNLSAAVVTNSTQARDSLVREDGFAPGKLRVIHNGVDLDAFFKARRQRARFFPGLDACKIVVLVGNMHTEVKGQPWLIAAAGAVRQVFPQVKFALVGDGEQRPMFEQQAADLGLKENILFLGTRRDVPELLACCDIAVLPSTAEGLPNAVLEYMAAGLPTIATAVGGNLELIEDGTTGLLVPPRNSEALARALLRLLQDEELAARLARAGRNQVRARFSFERLLAELDALYTALLSRKGLVA